ncbi:MAG: signal peptidase II [Gammaproteobacteria bacterium]|nr:signal peptidase II [Gammaproteobacteria bacterium]
MKHLKWLWLSLLVIILDQASKYWAEHVLQYEIIEILPIFDFSLAHNPGAAFGFLGGLGGVQHVFFISLAVLVSIVLVFMMVKKMKSHERHLAVAFSLIIGGAIGNAIDRVVYQYVVDFIHFFYRGWHYPHFNIADIAIFIGAALMISEAFDKPFLNSSESE